ncbi:MAG: phosphatidate cytidylyltransferase [Proteobacteria bacterium]|nr:phosphatidate cytidylyltransferase [Pseudomonadota bacterium]
MSRELRLRIISGVILALLAVGSDILGGGVFAAIWGAIALIMLHEWLSIIRAKRFFWAWGLGGIAYVAGMFFSVLALRGEGWEGLVAILFLFAIVWGADIGAYFAGRTFGGPKLAPRISPNKTWSGLVGGFLAAIVAGTILLALAGISPRPAHAAVAGLLALLSAAGDLFESAFKRRFGVKDSGRLIPGHGGFLDRLDGFVFAVIAAAMLGIARGGVPGAAGGLILW